MTDSSALSGSVTDVQIAINQVAGSGGGTAHVPEGSFGFMPARIDPYNSQILFGIDIPGGVNVVGDGLDKTILYVPSDISSSYHFLSMFKPHGENSKPIRISGISFKGITVAGSVTGDSAVVIDDCKDFRVDNCKFDTFGSGAVVVRNFKDYGNVVSQGVVDHCTFLDIYKSAVMNANYGYGYGVAVMKDYYIPTCPWETNPDNIFGNYNGNVFVEDCIFGGINGGRHDVMSFAGGCYVARHNIHQNHSAEQCYDVHPARVNTYGGRCAEIYNNLINLPVPITTKRVQGAIVQSGCGLFYNNQIAGCTDGIILGNGEDNSANVQISKLHGWYVWNNTFSSCWSNISTYGHETIGGMPAPIENTDYFLTQKTYTQYPYPHPLTMAFPHSLSINSSPSKIPFTVKKLS